MRLQHKAERKKGLARKMIGGGRGDKDGDVVTVRACLSSALALNLFSVLVGGLGASDESAVRDDEQVDELHRKHRRRRVSARQVPLGRAAVGRSPAAARPVVRIKPTNQANPTLENNV